MNIGVIGSGRLGICFALLLERAGYNVMVSDIRDDYVKSITNKFINTNEPSVNDILSSTTKLIATVDNKHLINQCDLIYCFVPTPSTEQGSYDISAIWQIVEDFKSSKRAKNKVFVIGSTVNPGDCKLIQESLNDLNIEIFYNPEFVAQGSIIKDLQNADIVLIGGKDNDSKKIIEKFYYDIQIVEPKIHTMSTTAAEITKLVVNSFLTIKISYANMVGDLLTNNGLTDEITKVLNCIGNDARIGNKFLNYGFGFGGPCLTRDNKSIVNFANKTNSNYELGSVADTSNFKHSIFLKNYFMSKNPDKSIPFYFDYITYKKGTDILTDSQQFKLCVDLLSEGHKVYINETPLVIEQVKEKLSNEFKGMVFFSGYHPLPNKFFRIDI